ncbi:ATP-dependent DNA helicase Q5 isoform X2 [Ptiloglossa arizonensis]
MCTYFQRLVHLLRQRNILSYIVFNEAHCLSKWGYEYTVSYKEINSLNKIYKYIPKIAVTTTVIDKVLEDICKLLTLKTPKIFKLPMQQINVQYDVWFLDILSSPFHHLKNFMIEVLGYFYHKDSPHYKMHEGFAIVYCREEVTAELIKDKLNTFGIPTLAYHYKLNNSTRRNIENKWISGEARIITTTYDYGFIHKQPVRCIVYWTVPENIAKYYRESAQTCKDSGLAFCRIYFSIKEYSSVKLVIENHRIMKDPEHIENRLSEYNKLVSYCLLIKCRHTVIGEYFGYLMQPCEMNCDVCQDNKIVKIRTLNFITHSDSIGGVKYDICDVNKNLKKEQIVEDNNDQLEEISENKFCAFEIIRKKNAIDENSEKEIVQSNDNLTSKKQKPSSSESSSRAAQLPVKDSVQTITEGTVKCAKHSNKIRTSIFATTQFTVDENNFNKQTILWESCSSRNNIQKDSEKQMNNTQVFSKSSESKNESKIENVNTVGSTQRIEKKDQILESDFCEIINVIVKAKEQTRKRKEFCDVVDTRFDEFEPKRRKSRTENKLTNVTRIQRDRRTSDRDKRVERIKDDVNESVSRDLTTVKYLMNKYKLNKDSITLVPLRK